MQVKLLSVLTLSEAVNGEMTGNSTPQVRRGKGGTGPTASGRLTTDDFDDLYRVAWPYLFRLSLLLTGDAAAAEDIVQDAFVGMFRRWHQMNDVSGAKAYVRRSVINGSYSALRKRRTAGEVIRRVASGSRNTTDAADVQVLLDAEHLQVLRGVQSLARRQREVLVLRYWGNLSEAEIAATLQISDGSVKSTASRAITKLSQLLEASDGN